MISIWRRLVNIYMVRGGSWAVSDYYQVTGAGRNTLVVTSGQGRHIILHEAVWLSGDITGRSMVIRKMTSRFQRCRIFEVRGQQHKAQDDTYCIVQTNGRKCRKERQGMGKVGNISEKILQEKCHCLVLRTAYSLFAQCSYFYFCTLLYEPDPE